MKKSFRMNVLDDTDLVLSGANFAIWCSGV